MNNELQTIYINIDDSGKISKKEHFAVYGGIIFLNKKEKDKFITQYKSIVNDIKCHYCPSKSTSCNNNNCPELKHNNLKNKDIRRIINYIKKYILTACIINNEELYDYIINNKASKGRYNDYALRRTIKGIISTLINNHLINPDRPINLIINIDEQSTKSNGYYNLKDGLLEELKYGITNFNYAKTYKPIINSDLTITLTYQKSDKSYVVQAADLIAGTVRKHMILASSNHKAFQKIMKYLNYKIFLP